MMIRNKLIKALTTVMVLAIALGIAACDLNTDTVNNTAKPAEATDDMSGNRPLDFKAEDLTWEIQNVFSGDHVKNETVMFIDKGDTKELLYKIDKVISVTSYNGKKTYEEGRDYEVVDGKLRVTEDSKIPCITSKKYYSGDGIDRHNTVVRACLVRDWQSGTLHGSTAGNVANYR